MTSIAPAEPSPQPIAERAAKAPIHVIRPWQTGVIKQFTDVIVWRRLMKFYGVSYMLRRVRKTWLGWIWIPLKPGIDILSRTFFFHQVLGAKSGDRPYFIFIAFGTAGWTIFHSVSHWATRAMRMSRVILKNAYVPRLTRLLAVLYPAALDFFMNSIVAIGAIFYYWFTRGKLYVNPLSLHSAVGF
jgi:lipopolysaccharide transport system permease protein